MNSIRGRLMITLAASLAAILAAGGAGIYFLTRAVLQKDFDTALHSAIPEVERVTRGSIIERPEEFHVFKPESNRDPPIYFEVWGVEGRLHGRSDSLTGRDLAITPAARPEPQDIVLPSGRLGRGMTVRIPIADEPAFSERLSKEKMEATLKGSRSEEIEHKLRLVPKTVVIAIAGDSSAMEAALRRLAWVLWTFGLIVLAVAVAVAAFVSQRGLAPLQQVAEQAGRVDASKLSFRFSTRNLPSELQTICERLNDLLARLDAAFARERCFTADVAHELRTPITELRSLAEIALAYASPDAATAGAFQDALDIALQMQGVVNGLLAIARCESGTQIMARETVDLTELVRKTWKRFEVHAARRGVRINFCLGESIFIQTDPGMLGLIFSNLMSNAAEYAPQNSLVQVRLESVGGGFIFTITNEAQNLTTEDLEHIFERFWRQDSARSSSEHSGIGLSIAHAYARALSFTLSASLGSDGLLALQLAHLPGRKSAVTVEETDDVMVPVARRNLARRSSQKTPPDKLEREQEREDDNLHFGERSW